jgi:hypothetical protein
MRRAYLVALALLQVALVVTVAPPLSAALRHAAIVDVPDPARQSCGWPSSAWR